MVIRSARDTDIESIINIHMQAFPNFFLTNMGRGFLRELYRGFMTNAILLVAENQHNLGFAAGSCHPKEFFAQLRHKRGLMFIMYALPALLRSPRVVFRKLMSAFSYSGDKVVSLEGGALLSSIGVLPGEQGRSIGGALLAAFEDEVFSRDCEYIYLTTDAVDNDAVNGFYKYHSYLIESTFMQVGGRAMNRYVKHNPLVN